MNYYNNGSFFALLLVVLQVSTNSPFFVASDPESAEAVVSLDTVLITDSPSSNSTPDSDTSEREGFVSSSDTKPSRCSKHDDCEPRDSFFCVPGVCQEKLGDNEQCEDNEWCKKPLTCLDGECVQISTTRFGGELCSGDGECNEGFFCHRKFCIKKRGAGVRCKDDNWCKSGLRCVKGFCGSNSDNNNNNGSNNNISQERTGGGGTPVEGRKGGAPSEKCDEHKDCGRNNYCIFAGEKTGDDKKCEGCEGCKRRQQIGNSCDDVDKNPAHRICKKGLKCGNVDGKNICVETKSRSRSMMDVASITFTFNKG